MDRVYQSGINEGSKIHSLAVYLVEEFYTKDWNNYHEVAAEAISDAIFQLDRFYDNKRSDHETLQSM